MASLSTVPAISSAAHLTDRSAAHGGYPRSVGGTKSRQAAGALRLRLVSSSSSRGRRGASFCRAQAEEASVAAVAADPQINLQFIGPNNSPVADFSLGSGTKNLRRAMLDAKVPLYDMYGSLMNCGGGGSCGTCLVDIKEGGELLSEKTSAEDKFLKKRPETWRLACQTIVGDKTNAGTIVVRTMPQKN